MNKEANLIVIAAPSGAGKTSLVRALVQQIPKIKISVSYTTREPRPGDQEGVDYCFVSQDEFLRKVKENDFLEHAQVYGQYYGTSRSWVLEQLEAGIDVILEIDWQGAQQIHRLMPHSTSIFIVPPSIATLRERLVQRQQDHPEVIEQRLDLARSEIAHYLEFDYLVVNDDFEHALEDLVHIIRAGRLKSQNQTIRHAKLLGSLLKG
ncbi:MAG TPA: guanylate kinase [Coxiellaceae bacterium]|nr:guanylate kinase [Coxiellaceae bacterium]